MKLLLDMNVSPLWSPFLREHGIAATHWSDVGDPRAPDSVIMDWARSERFVVFTHDLDFSALLAAAGSRGPSVFQVRTHDVLPDATGVAVLAAIDAHRVALEQGAIVVLDRSRARVRVLPLRSRPKPPKN